jgi:hypothetical protein
MKNIHILPTDKPSRLHEFGDIWFSHKEPTECFRNYNIYITSDEEIKEGVDQWYLDKVLNEPYNSGGAQYSSNQDVIILTTDQDLIKNGIQGIDDEFLEWFVKNPSCEWVEVLTDAYTMQEIFELKLQNGVFKYKIIIPQEKPKQETLEEDLLDTVIQIVGDSDCTTIKEFFVKHNWQQEQERMYSEEDMIEFAVWLYLEVGSNKEKDRTNKELFNKWFEQFKKK